MSCEFCKKVLSSKGNLNYHQKNNKTCLLIQQKINENEIEIALVDCEFCNQSFSESNLAKHLQKCKTRPLIEIIRKDKEVEIIRKEKDKEIEMIREDKDNEVEIIRKEKDNEIEMIRKEKDKEIEMIRKEKDKEIEKLKKLLKKLKNKNINLTIEVHALKVENGIYSKDHKEIINMAKEPKTIIGNNFFSDSEKIKEIINTRLDRFDIAGGQKGIAQFALNNLLKNDDGIPNYVCTDPSRHIFKFQNEDGQVEKDVKATKLTNLLFDGGLKDKSYDIGKKLWTKEDGSHDSEKFRMHQPKIYEINSMNSDNSSFRNELVCLTTTK